LQQLDCYSVYIRQSVPLKEPVFFSLIYAGKLILGVCHLAVDNVIASVTVSVVSLG